MSAAESKLAAAEARIDELEALLRDLNARRRHATNCRKTVFPFDECTCGFSDLEHRIEAVIGPRLQRGRRNGD